MLNITTQSQLYLLSHFGSQLSRHVVPKMKKLGLHFEHYVFKGPVQISHSLEQS